MNYLLMTDLHISYKQTLEGDWIATVPRYPELVGQGVTMQIAFQRLLKLVTPRLQHDEAEEQPGKERFFNKATPDLIISGKELSKGD